MSDGDLRAADRTVVASTRGGGLATSLHWYSRIMTVPATVSALGFLVVVVSALVPRWRGSLRASSESLLWAGFGMGIIVISVATSASDPRYGVPVLPCFSPHRNRPRLAPDGDPHAAAVRRGPRPSQCVLDPPRSANRGGSFDVWVMNRDVSGKPGLTTDPGLDGFPDRTAICLS